MKLALFCPKRICRNDGQLSNSANLTTRFGEELHSIALVIDALQGKSISIRSATVSYDLPHEFGLMKFAAKKVENLLMSGDGDCSF